MIKMFFFSFFSFSTAIYDNKMARNCRLSIARLNIYFYSWLIDSYSDKFVQDAHLNEKYNHIRGGHKFYQWWQ